VALRTRPVDFLTVGSVQPDDVERRHQAQPGKISILFIDGTMNANAQTMQKLRGLWLYGAFL
jgi:hypothetical protein